MAALITSLDLDLLREGHLARDLHDPYLHLIVHLRSGDENHKTLPPGKAIPRGAHALDRHRQLVALLDRGRGATSNVESSIIPHICTSVRLFGPFEGEQLLVRAALDDAALVDHEDQVGHPDRREAVGDDEGGAALGEPAQRELDGHLRLGIDGAGGLVEDEDARIGHHRAGEDVTVTNRSTGWAALALQGPRSRDVLGQCTDAALDNAGFRWLTAQEITVAGKTVWAMRISYAGELGWELHIPYEDTLAVYDALWEAGEAHGIAEKSRLKCKYVDDRGKISGSDPDTRGRAAVGAGEGVKALDQPAAPVPGLLPVEPVPGYDRVAAGAAGDRVGVAPGNVPAGEQAAHRLKLLEIVAE